jgi:hypothetical protein
VKAVLALALVVLPLMPARAQLRTVPVPAGAEVVIPPRGAVPVQPPRSSTRARAAEAEAWPEDDLNGPSAWTYVLVPLVAGAAAALATNLPGGGGGGGGSSGPVRTR